MRCQILEKRALERKQIKSREIHLLKFFFPIIEKEEIPPRNQKIVSVAQKTFQVAFFSQIFLLNGGSKKIEFYLAAVEGWMIKLWQIERSYTGFTEISIHRKLVFGEKSVIFTENKYTKVTFAEDFWWSSNLCKFRFTKNFWWIILANMTDDSSNSVNPNFQGIGTWPIEIPMIELYDCFWL